MDFPQGGEKLVHFQAGMVDTFQSAADFLQQSGNQLHPARTIRRGIGGLDAPDQVVHRAQTLFPFIGIATMAHQALQHQHSPGAVYHIDHHRGQRLALHAITDQLVDRVAGLFRLGLALGGFQHPFFHRFRLTGFFFQEAGKALFQFGKQEQVVFVELVEDAGDHVADFFHQQVPLQHRFLFPGGGRDGERY